ncbi:MAG: phage holin [Oscillospiraceae bacterium]|nr:phage holin [Oscillospiraceae bacterium]
MSNKTYDILKYIAQIVLPALGALYFALAKIWALPYGEEIVGTISAIDAFMGALLKISSNAYYKANADDNINPAPDVPAMPDGSDDYFGLH